MQKNYTDITLLVDRSGSMEIIKSDTIGGLREFVSKQRGGPGKCHITMYQFDHHEGVSQVDPVFSKDVNEIKDDDVKLDPRGWTPLLDATGMTIKRVGERLSAMAEDRRPELVVFCIATDGLENRSTEYTSQHVKEMIEHQEKVYSWQFVYIGANQDAFAVSQEIGIRKNFSPYTGDRARAAYEAMGSNVRAYREMKTAAALRFSDDQMKKMNE